MPRIRSIKPDFFLDDEITILPYPVRLAFIGLWCHADKEGRLEDKPRHLKAVIFPYDEIDMETTLERLANHPKTEGQPFITRYETDGHKYIQVNGFTKHQRPHHTEQASIIPPNKPSRNRSQPVPKQEGKEAVIKEAELLRNSLFEKFWKVWPKKVDKAKCKQWWERNKPDEDLVGLMIQNIEAMKKTSQWEDKQFIPGPYRWLYGKRWEDEIPGTEEPTPNYFEENLTKEELEQKRLFYEEQKQ